MARKGSTYQVDVKITQILLKYVEHEATIRVGWLTPQFAVFTHWKRMSNGEVSWKTPLVQSIDRGTRDICFYLYQKVGSTDVPVGKIELPIDRIYKNEGQKCMFREALQEVVNGEGQISGWIRSKKVPENPELSAISSSRSWRNANDMSINSISDSQTVGESVDLSLDLTGEIPNKFYPIVSMQQKYLEWIEEEFNTSENQILFVAVLKEVLKVSADKTEFIIPMSDKTSQKAVIDWFMTLGMMLDATTMPKNGDVKYLKWNIPDKACDLSALQSAIWAFDKNFD